MSILQYIGIGLFVLFCLAMIWQIQSELNETSRSIARGYAFANITHSAKVFEATGVDLFGEIDYLDVDKKSAKKTTPKPESKDNKDWHFEL